MVLKAPSQSKIPTKIPQPARTASDRPGRSTRGSSRSRRVARPGSLLRGDAREATRGDDRVVLEVEGGVTVYPAREPGGRWRAVWKENGQRRQCEAVSEDRLAARLTKVTERLMADAPNLERPGADLIAWYLSPGRHPAVRPWSAKHADTQRRLCERFAAPVLAAVTCQDIKVADMQRAVNAAPTPGEGARLHRCLSAMVTAGITGGYLTNPRLREAHWQPGNRPAPAPQVTMQGETAQFVDPSQIPAAADVARLGRALAAGRRGDLQELMANAAAYSGLRQGELFALTAGQIDPAARVIDVDRKVIEVGGKLLTGAPKGRKRRKTIYPARTPQAYPLAEKIAARIGAARAERDAGSNPLGLMFPSPRGTYWRSSNFDRRVLAPAYLEAGWRDAAGNGPWTWTWHSLRHVLCTTALFTWKLDATDVSAMAGHANVRTTLDMYIGTTAGVLDRARTATA
jgi:integrase